MKQKLFSTSFIWGQKQEATTTDTGMTTYGVEGITSDCTMITHKTGAKWYWMQQASVKCKWWHLGLLCMMRQQHMKILALGDQGNRALLLFTLDAMWEHLLFTVERIGLGPMTESPQTWKTDSQSPEKLLIGTWVCCSGMRKRIHHSHLSHHNQCLHLSLWEKLAEKAVCNGNKAKPKEHYIYKWYFTDVVRSFSLSLFLYCTLQHRPTTSLDLKLNRKKITVWVLS